jgi:hypothetical protein
MSKSVSVDCGICHETIGEQTYHGEGEQLFRKHLILAHPKEAAAVHNAEHAIARIPWPPEPKSTGNQEGTQP